MARYKIWNGTDTVYTFGAPYKFTPDEWRAKYPWAEVATCVISGDGVINGAFCMPLDTMIANAERAGCDFSGCETDEEKLAVYEAFEDAMNTPSEEPTTEERIAAALEYQVMASLPDEETTDTANTNDTTNTEGA